MIYICPKCGKKMDLSNEVLIRSDYKVICPQCLSELQIVGDYAYIPDDTLGLGTTVEPSHMVICPKCGHEASSNAHFCPNCGSSFDTTTSMGQVTDVPAEDVTILPPPIPNSDPLYNDALQFLMTCTAITPMMLRDHFRISDERASELLRQLEAGGAVGPYNHGGPRQILIPHRTLYGPAPEQAQDHSANDSHQAPARRGPGCITVFILVMFLVIMIKSCGG